MCRQMVDHLGRVSESANSEPIDNDNSSDGRSSLDRLAHAWMGARAHEFLREQRLQPVHPFWERQ